MSGIGVHDFKIPHHLGKPTRDMVVLRLPMPPKKIGSMIIPDVVRDMAFHNVAAGRIIAMGPVAFAYKNGEGVSVQDAKIGDWAIIRPYAGTMMQGGEIVANGGWRYVSSFNDVISIVAADDMPDPSTLLWGEEDSQQHVEGGAVDPKAEALKTATAQFSFDNKKA